MKNLIKYLKKNGIYYSIKSIFLQIKIKKLIKKRIIFNSSFNENFNFNTKYLFEYFFYCMNKDDYEVKFIINDECLYKNLKQHYGDFFINTKTLKNIKYILEAKIWVTSTIDPPIIEFFKNKNRILYHLGHGIPLKNIIMAEKNLSLLKKINRKFRTKNFTHALATSEYTKKIIEKCFLNSQLKVVIKGQPRNDKLFIEKEDEKYFNKEKKYILYSPTWRPYENTKIFPFNDFKLSEIEEFLELEDMILYIRKHPYYEIDYDKKILSSKRIKFLNSDIIPDIMPYLNKFFLLITDYSSIYLDFVLLNKPMIFFDYDYERYKKEVGFSFDYFDNTPGPKIKSQKIFLMEVKKYLNDKDYYNDKREIVNNRFNKYKTDNCKINWEYILELAES